MSQFSEFDQKMMRLALSLAEKGRYSTKPNPAVGCVITQGDQIIGQGWHKKAGEAHAEINAINDALANGHDLEGTTAYVTLEPCSHYGKTGPCSEALAKHKVGRLVAAMEDTNPLVSGNGFKICQTAGMSVSVGLFAEEAKLINEGFIYAMEKKLPFVRLKMASSLDGRSAMSSGESHWITGEASRKQVHKMRAQHGALITGIGTVLADDPSLNVRLSSDELAEMNLTEENCHPIRVVLDANLSMPTDAKMLSLPGRTVLISTKQTIEDNRHIVDAFLEQGAEIVAVAAEGDKLDIESVLQYLFEAENVNEVMVEAGAVVAGAFIQSGFVNEIHTFYAPILMGQEAKPMFSLEGMEKMNDKIEFSLKTLEQVGEDIHMVFQPKKS